MLFVNYFVIARKISRSAFYMEEDLENAGEVVPDFANLRKKDNVNYRLLCREYARLISPPFIEEVVCQRYIVYHSNLHLLFS